MYKPSFPYNVKAQILTATVEKIKGIPTKTYSDGNFFFCSCKAYGGTEKIINNQYVIENTAVIETHYRTDIQNKDKIKLLKDNSEWEIISPIENIDYLNKHLKFKIKRINGGA